MSIPKIEVPGNEKENGKEFHTLEGKELLAHRIRLIEPEAQPKSLLWCVRFALDITQSKPDQVNAFYVEGILDANGGWAADFAEPIQDQPTAF